MALGHMSSRRALGLRKKEAMGSNSRTDKPPMQQAPRLRERDPVPDVQACIPVPANPRPRETPTLDPWFSPLENHSVVSHELQELIYNMRLGTAGQEGKKGAGCPCSPLEVRL